MRRTHRKTPADQGRDRRLEWLVALAMIAFLSSSLAQVFVLPHGEGFDEMGHYSYVALVADEGRLPVLQQDTVDAAWERHLERLPGPYGIPVTTVTYREFFDEPDAAQREAIAAWRARPDEPARYTPGARVNWEAQHPPLYYWLMAPVYKLTAHLSMAQRVLWMRLVSVIIGATSIVFFWLAWRAAATKTQQRLALGVAVAALTPSLVLDVARIGNESLAMAIGAALFWQMLVLRNSQRPCNAEASRKLFHREQPWLTVVVIGVLLGLGLLTKAFFVAFAPGVLVTVAIISRRRASWRTVLVQCAVVVLLCAAIAGWWHVRSYQLYDLWVPTNDALIHRGAPGAGLGPAAFAAEFARGLALRWATYFYCGTWSWALMAVWWFVPFAVISVLVVAGFVWRFRPAFWRSDEQDVRGERRSSRSEAEDARGERRPSRCPTTVVLIPLVTVLVAFLMHLHFVVHYEGVARGGGHYFHVAWPFIALLVGTALVQFRRAWHRALIAAALIGCFIACRAGDLAQLLITGGIAGKAPSGFLHVPPGTGLSSIGTALANLGRLVPLAPGLAFYALGIAAQIALVVVAVRCALDRGTANQAQKLRAHQ